MVSFKNPSAHLISLLRETGLVGDENGKKLKNGSKKGIDMEKLAESLVKLNENPNAHLISLLRETGPVGDENGKKLSEPGSIKLRVLFPR